MHRLASFASNATVTDLVICLPNRRCLFQEDPFQYDPTWTRTNWYTVGGLAVSLHLCSFA